MPRQPITDADSGQIFTVEQVDGADWQSVFPERLADQSAIHSSESAAWDWVEEVIRRESEATQAHIAAAVQAATRHMGVHPRHHDCTKRCSHGGAA